MTSVCGGQPHYCRHGEEARRRRLEPWPHAPPLPPIDAAIIVPYGAAARSHKVTPRNDVSRNPAQTHPGRAVLGDAQNFRRKGVRTDWADANKPGQTADCFIEGPAFDASGDLYIVDIPFGRIFRIAPDKSWSLVAEYDGWPNGMKIGKDGRILVADYMHGIMQLDAKTGHMLPVLTSRNSELFRGCNDLHIASNGDIYFTDQGQTGLHDPTGLSVSLRPAAGSTALLTPASARTAWCSIQRKRHCMWR